MTFFDRLFHRDAGGTLTRRAPAVAAASWNAQARTFEAVLSTGAAVERQDARGAYDELLDLSGASLPERIPLLDSHARDSVDRVLGSVAGMRVVNGELVGTTTLSRHNPQAQRIANEISDGARFGLSVGYRVRTWRDGTANGRRTRTAAAWDVLEASLVAVSADDRAGMREEQDMTHRNTTPPAPGSRAATNAELRTIASTAGLTREHADGWIDRELTVEAARSEAFQAMRERTEPAATISTVTRARELDDPQERIRAMGEAIYMRSNPAHRPSDRARAYAGLSLVEMARESLRAAGVSTTGLSAATVIERATGGMVGLHTTSDFALALGDSVGRVIREAYAAAPSPLRQVARRVTVPDFRERAVIRMTPGMALEKVNEHGEFRGGSMFETGETYRVETYGKIFGITRQAIVNDDKGALTDIPRMMGAAASAFEANFIAQLFVTNALMADGFAVFSTQHANIAAAGGAIDLTTLSAARLAMRSQTDEAGQVIGVVPKFLIVAPDRETEAEQALAEIAAATTATTNPFAGTLTLIVEPRLPAGGWFVSADPAVMPSVEIATLEGEQEPEVRTEVGFDVDGTRFRVRLDVGGAFVDWRGVYYNDGTP
jgi:hypothetical protein